MKLKKIIIILIIILVILLIAVGIILQHNKKVISEYQGDPAVEIPQVEIDTKLKEVSIRNNFYAVKNCVNKFYTYYAGIYSNTSDSYIIDEETQSYIENTKKQNIEAVYNMLDEEYINEKSVTLDNVASKLKNINSSIVNITDMYVSEKSDNISIYIVYGTLREESTSKISNFKVIIKLDSMNRTFSVLPQDYIDEKYSNLALENDINIQVPTNIQKNEYNAYSFENITDQEYAINLFNQYREELLYNAESVYNNLDEEYRKLRFGTLENFNTYAKNNFRKNVIMQIAQYQKTEKDGYTQYICVDQNGNYYIFKETSVMKYTLILDTYTIDLPEFVEKYNNATESEKVLYNIQKIFQAINLGDYGYVYKKLDDTFKTNNFNTQAEFERYMKEKFYENNEVSYGENSKTGNVYVYNLKISDKDSKKTMNGKVVMQLKEGTDFVMSFSIDE